MELPAGGGIRRGVRKLWFSFCCMQFKTVDVFITFLYGFVSVKLLEEIGNPILRCAGLALGG